MDIRELGIDQGMQLSQKYGNWGDSEGPRSWNSRNGRARNKITLWGYSSRSPKNQNFKKVGPEKQNLREQKLLFMGTEDAQNPKETEFELRSEMTRFSNPLVPLDQGTREMNPVTSVRIQKEFLDPGYVIHRMSSKKDYISICATGSGERRRSFTQRNCAITWAHGNELPTMWVRKTKTVRVLAPSRKQAGFLLGDWLCVSIKQSV